MVNVLKSWFHFTVENGLVLGSSLLPRRPDSIITSGRERWKGREGPRICRRGTLGRCVFPKTLGFNSDSSCPPEQRDCGSSVQSVSKAGSEEAHRWPAAQSQDRLDLWAIKVIFNVCGLWPQSDYQKGQTHTSTKSSLKQFPFKDAKSHKEYSLN